MLAWWRRMNYLIVWGYKNKLFIMFAAMLQVSRQLRALVLLLLLLLLQALPCGYPIRWHWVWTARISSCKQSRNWITKMQAGQQSGVAIGQDVVIVWQDGWDRAIQCTRKQCSIEASGIARSTGQWQRRGRWGELTGWKSCQSWCKQQMDV